jgi:hypothetical protein
MKYISNLFIELHEAKCGTDEHRLGTGWENLFTEQFAFFLAADLPAATAVAHMLLFGKEVSVKSVSTQVNGPEGTPDLQLGFVEGGCLYLEHKFDSPLGLSQLERYLKLGQKVALVSRCNQSVHADVLNVSNYCRPADRDYFHWVDIYEALRNAEPSPEGFGALRNHFLAYMRELGLAPISPELRPLFDTRTDPAIQAMQKEFGRWLDPVKAEFRKRGFRVEDVSHSGKQAYAQSGEPWRHLYVRPDIVRADYLRKNDYAAFDPGYEALVAEIVFDKDRSDVASATYKTLCDGAACPDGQDCFWYAVSPRPINRDRIRVSLATPLAPYFRREAGLSKTLCASALWAIDTLLQAVEKGPKSQLSGGSEEF